MTQRLCFALTALLALFDEHVQSACRVWHRQWLAHQDSHAILQPETDL